MFFRKKEPLYKGYDLKAVFQEINRDYFDNKIDIEVQWFGRRPAGRARYRVLGMYVLDDQMIKIHRILDHPKCPDYFLKFVLYHEMLHHIYPPQKGRRGKRLIHHATFKEKERLFKDYERAKAWEKRGEFYTWR